MGELGQKKCSNYLSSHLMLYHRLVGRGGKNPYRTARLIYILAVHISSSLDNSLLLTARYMVVWSRRASWNGGTTGASCPRAGRPIFCA